MRVKDKCQLSVAAIIPPSSFRALQNHTCWLQGAEWRGLYDSLLLRYYMFSESGSIFSGQYEERV